MLLKGQGLTIERPPRTTGTAVGAGAALLAMVLAAALFVKSSGWPVSFPAFLAYAVIGLLLVLAGLIGFWAYSCWNLRYVLDRSGLTINWGLLRHFISIDQIQKLMPGRGEQRPKAEGIGWPGYHIGRGYVEGVGRVLFFSTHRTPEELVYVQTSDAVYAISPQDPVRFIAEAQRYQQGGAPQRPSGVDRDLLSAHPIWWDAKAQLLGAAAVVLNVALWGFIFAVYPELDREITLEFPPIGDITTQASRSEILKIPATATGFLAANLVIGLVYQWRERAAAYLLIAAAVIFQAVFWVAAVYAVLNA